MFKFITDNTREFWQGSIASGTTSGVILFTSNVFLLDIATKILLAGLIAAVGGFSTALVSDIYKHHFQKKFFKKKQDEQNKKDKAA